ncbi:unnamed protein product [Sordaria macrospora k-hell]|uniref:WGS project CABT00000000 data, contig 2.8 n=1 Tax=Sordaria macrospora (strain ATCC MYA-333 / DSM 997 / K(L3346) / K-hell) TaxID=771870 RepID=F7VV29_SORMK|nr:uncharacterized protein SMAC_05208 [Sordaria macrospora k-hell]CCC09376.1 unnamed protein product [Sordaria macrospora k-hell]
MAGGDDLSKKEVNILPHDTQKDEQKNSNNPLNKLADGAKATFEQASKAMPGPAILRTSAARRAPRRSAGPRLSSLTSKGMDL